MKLTLTPVSFVNSAKTLEAYFSGMMEYAFSCSAALTDPANSVNAIAATVSNFIETSELTDEAS